ncbi:uncharacterized protein LY79DRAFT_528490 [Colletotrichum navitas]|uniref:Ubiquitin-like protease family profile domain-containing protein n=1 Tax=Colletotrichum navitas TaxID=681940 RepID=A0AAD8PLM1_9PEZI|nr:uncharacterized protein LY79DRAFT_528490 [Colletotrichum navitas]KAK1569544.1 hypothetical protein LY79DRAFT_528490 [Colletotrichum navitas]
MLPSDFDVAKDGAYEEDLKDAEQVLIPLHLKRATHWVLLAIKLGPLEVEVFDSIPNASLWKKDIEASVRNLCGSHLQKFLGSGTPAVVFCQSLQQVGGTDCGVYTLIHAAYLIAGRRLPANTDINAWRQAISSFNYGARLDAEDTPWKLYPELDDAVFEIEDDMAFPRKGARITDKEWSAAIASRRAYEDKMNKILIKTRTRNLHKLDEHHKDIREVLAVIHDVLASATPEQREQEIEQLSKEYLARQSILSSLKDIPNPTQADREFGTSQKDRKRACLRRTRTIRMSSQALKAAECRLQLELGDVLKRQQDLKDRGVEVET